MKTLTRFIGIMCVLIFTLSIMTYTKVYASMNSVSGVCGDDLTWKLNKGVLTVSGTGTMNQYACSERTSVPWHSYKSQINKVVIEEGVTSVGMNMFISCENLTEISLPSTLTYIGRRAFQDCNKLESIVIPYGVTEIDHLAFAGDNLLAVYIPSYVTSFGDNVFSSNYNLTLICNTGSDAESYAKAENIKYTSDISLLNNLENYKNELIKKEEYILCYKDINFNILYCLNRNKNKVTLKWDDVKGAKKYKIYLYNISKNQFSYIGNAENPTCTIKLKKLKSNRSYWFKISAITDNGNIEDSITIKP